MFDSLYKMKYYSPIRFKVLYHIITSTTWIINVGCRYRDALILFGTYFSIILCMIVYKLILHY